MSLCLILSASAALVGPDGRAYSRIVVTPDAPDSVRLAANELKSFLARRCAADLPIVSSAAAEDEAAIFLGNDPDAAKLPSDGFRIRTAPGRLVIAGRDSVRKFSEFEGRNPFRRVEIYNEDLKLAALMDQGTLCGVYAFLEDFCGIRFYWPGDDGTVVPEPSDVKLPEVDVMRAPRFSYRYPWFCNFSRDRDCPLWFRRVGFGGQAPAVIIDSFYMAQFLRKDHPEFFALVDGERDFDSKCAVRGGGHLCLNAKGLVEAWAVKIREFFDSHPDMEVYPVTPGDGLTRICECPLCQADLRPELGDKGKFSHHVWKFVNAMAREIAKTHPKRFIGCLAYEHYWTPPEDIDFAPNTAVMICQARKGMANDRSYEEFWKGADAWSRKAGRVYFWNWYLTNWPPTDRLPVFYPRTIARDIARMAANPKCFGEFIEAENFDRMFPFGSDRMGTPGMSHLNLYLTGKLYWNPRLDVRATLDEYYRLFYGPAEKEMRAFWEESASSLEGGMAQNAKASPDELFPRTTLLKLRRHLDEAGRMVPPDSVYARRIAVVDGEFRVGAGRLTRMQTVGTAVMDVRPVSGPRDLDKLGPMRFRAFDADAGEPPTWVYGGYDRRNLHLKFLCYEPEMGKVRARYTGHDDARMWDDDCLELCLCPAGMPAGRGFGLMVNVAGALWDARRWDALGTDAKWESGADVSVRREANRWVVEISLPFESMGISDINFAGDISANFYRVRASVNPEQTFVWSPTGVNAHFCPGKFGRLKFVK